MENKENTKVSAMVDELILSSQGLCKCYSCGVEKPISEFYACKNRKNGLERNCKKCHADLLDRDKSAEVMRNYRKNLKKDPVKKLFLEARNRAKRLSIPFGITPENIYVPKHCPVFGVELTIGGSGREDNDPSLDRIDPTLGYIPGNIAVICFKANRLKNDASLSELIAVRDYMRSQENIQKAYEAKNASK
jgi:hypothetical protein